MKWNKFICPIDGLPLIQNGSTLRCKKGHSYDLAREGYCNLLLVQQKASHEPGDTHEMVMARRRFLGAGFYLPLAEKIAGIAASLVNKKSEFRILDAGSGEGYYLRYIHSKNPALQLVGIDISKPAVKAAAKLSPQISWAVASNKQLPLESTSIDLILCMFGFPVWNSFAKVQESDGCVLLVDAGADHLIELREIIYPSVTKSTPPSVKAALDNGYQLVSELPLNFSIQLNTQEQISDLLAMTPHAHRISDLGVKRLADIQELVLTVDLIIRLLRLK